MKLLAEEDEKRDCSNCGHYNDEDEGHCDDCCEVNGLADNWTSEDED